MSGVLIVFKVEYESQYQDGWEQPLLVGHYLSEASAKQAGRVFESSLPEDALWLSDGEPWFGLSITQIEVHP